MHVLGQRLRLVGQRIGGAHPLQPRPCPERAPSTPAGWRVGEPVLRSDNGLNRRVAFVVLGPGMAGARLVWVRQMAASRVVRGGADHMWSAVRGRAQL